MLVSTCHTTQTHNSVRPTKPTICIFSIVMWRYWWKHLQQGPPVHIRELGGCLFHQVMWCPKFKGKYQIKKIINLFQFHSASVWACILLDLCVVLAYKSPNPGTAYSYDIRTVPLVCSQQRWLDRQTNQIIVLQFKNVWWRTLKKN